VTDDGFWRQFWRAYRKQWGWRDVLAYPLVYLLTMLVSAALFGREWTTDRWVGVALVSVLAWPTALWVVDRTVRRP
jgi:hypothetical protein